MGKRGRPKMTKRGKSKGSQKKKIAIKYNSEDSKTLNCYYCGNPQTDIASNTVKVTCPICVTSLNLQEYGMPKGVVMTAPEDKKLQGWHFMKVFVDKDGNVFHRGKEQPELKGTLEPTKLKKQKPRVSKADRMLQNQTKFDSLEKEIKEIKKKIKGIQKAGKKAGLIGLNKLMEKKLKEQRKYV